MRRAYQERRDLLLDGLKGQIRGRECRSRAVPSMRLRTSAPRSRVATSGRSSSEWLGFGVAVLPGTAFRAGVRGWIRLSLATRQRGRRRSRGTRPPAAWRWRRCGRDDAVLPRVRRRLPTGDRGLSALPGDPDAGAGAGGGRGRRRSRPSRSRRSRRRSAVRHPGARTAFRPVLRSATLPGYGAGAPRLVDVGMGEILVVRALAVEARALHQRLSSGSGRRRSGARRGRRSGGMTSRLSAGADGPRALRSPRAFRPDAEVSASVSTSTSSSSSISITEVPGDALRDDHAMQGRREHFVHVRDRDQLEV